VRKWPRILFFINGSIPSEEEVAEAESLGFNVTFRNALFVAAEGALEACDGVAGDVPERYAAKYPSAEEVVEEFKTGSVAKVVSLGEIDFEKLNVNIMKKLSSTKTLDALNKLKVAGLNDETSAAIRAKEEELSKPAEVKPKENPSAAWKPNA
jgi:hypothetical protein